MKKKGNYFLTGMTTVLPVVLFVIIVNWLVSLTFGCVGWITSLFPQSMWRNLGLSEIAVKMLGFLILCAVIWFIGFVMNQRRVGKKLKDWFQPIVSRIPLLSTLSKIVNQTTKTLKDTNSFKEVVIVRFPIETTWSVGFLTREDFERRLATVFIPTAPSPASGALVVVRVENLTRTDVPVSTAISFIISMGMADASLEIMKKAHSYLE